MSEINILPLPALSDNYIWAIVNTDGNVMVVDPGEAAPIINFLQSQQLTLAGILVTHHHWDHTNGISALKKQYDVPVIGSAASSITSITEPATEQHKVQLTGFPWAFQVIAIPGHTLDHIAYYSPGILFCGDTLFAAGCGKVFEGTAEQMYTSLQKLAALPDDTHVYCAHEYTLSNLRFAALAEPSNPAINKRIQQVTQLREANRPSLPSLLGDEKATNPFLRCDSPEVIKQVEAYAKQPLKDPVAVFAWLRQWKDAVT